MFKFKHAFMALGALPLATAASATSYDLTHNFGSPVFSYGSGGFANGALTFHAFSNVYNGCFNVGGFSCTTSGPAGDTSGSSNLPGIGATASGAHFLTVDVPAGDLWAHPSNAASDNDAIIQFTAQEAGRYLLDGLFARLDNMTSGSNDPGNNGVSVSIFATSGGITSLLYSSSVLAGYGVTQGATATYDFAAQLGAGDVISYVINNNGNYYNDSTGLGGTIAYAGGDNSTAAVPEPTSWSMMVLGFGLAGLGLRASRRRTAVTFA